MRNKTNGWIVAALWVAGVQGFHSQSSPALPPPAATVVDYDQHVRPILTARCFGCHGPTQQQSGLRLDLRQNALRGGDYGTVIVPGKSAESRLILRLTGSTVGLQMPPTGALEPEEIAVLRAWIDQGADMPGRAAERTAARRVTGSRLQALLDAIHRHDLSVVRKALAADRTLISAVDSAGSTALMHAAYAGTLDIMNALLDAGADVNARNDRKATALHWALTDASKLRLLLSKGADANAKTVEGRTVLYSAAAQPAGAAIVRLLVEAGADVNARTILGTTPLFQAVAASAESARILLDNGADPNARSATGATPLMAIPTPAALALLVARGADVKMTTKRNETALAMAADRGDLEGVRLMLDKGADVNAVDFRGFTPLMYAAQYDRDSPELIRLLLSRGARVDATAEGETAVTLAAKRGETRSTRLLREAQTNRPSSPQ